MPPKSPKRTSATVAVPKGNTTRTARSGSEEAEGGAGDATDQPRDPRLEGIRLVDLPNSVMASRAEEQQVFQLLGESFETITDVFVHYAKSDAFQTIFAATRLSFGTCTPNPVAVARSSYVMQRPRRRPPRRSTACTP